MLVSGLLIKFSKYQWGQRSFQVAAPKLWNNRGGGGGGGALQYQMDTGVRLTLPKAGAFGENTVSKNEETLGEKPNFGSKLCGTGRECYF